MHKYLHNPWTWVAVAAILWFYLYGTQNPLTVLGSLGGATVTSPGNSNAQSV